MTRDRAAKLYPVTLTDPQTFLVLAVHAAGRDESCQRPRISRTEALAELARDCRVAELRALMEDA